MQQPDSFHDGPFDLSTYDLKSFESLFHRHYQWLCLITFKLTNNWNEAEDIVQDFFARCWQQKNAITIRESWKAFAATSVKNAALNYLRKENIRQKHETAAQSLISGFQSEAQPASANEQDERYFQLIEAVNRLPEQRRRIFLLSRKPQMRYVDIAEELGISVNTVKMHVRLAYQELRTLMKVLMVLYYFFIK